MQVISNDVACTKVEKIASEANNPPYTKFAARILCSWTQRWEILYNHTKIKHNIDDDDDNDGGTLI